MGQITDWIKKNSTLAEGADIKEAEKLEDELNPLKNLSTTDQYLDFMNRNEGFKNALKKHETQAIEKHDAKFKTDKLPGLLKEHGDKIKAEINPTDTPEQKEIKELKQWKVDSEARDKSKDLKLELVAKAKELGYTGDIDLFMSKGDTAIETMESYHEKNTKYLEVEREKIQKEVYKGNPPPNRGEPEVPKDIDTQIFEARKAGNSMLAGKLQVLKNTKTQQ